MEDAKTKLRQVPGASKSSKSNTGNRRYTLDLSNHSIAQLPEKKWTRSKRPTKHVKEKPMRLQFECDLDESAVKQHLNLSQLLAYSPCPKANCFRCKGATKTNTIYRYKDRKSVNQHVLYSLKERKQTNRGIEILPSAALCDRYDNRKCPQRRKSAHSKKRTNEIDYGTRPDPEGASSPSPIIPNHGTPFDGTAAHPSPLSHSLLYSDYGNCSQDAESDSRYKYLDTYDQLDDQNVIIRGLAAANLNSSTLIKYAIISSELTNIVKQNLRKTESEVLSLAHRIQQFDHKLETAKASLQETREWLQDASHQVKECERDHEYSLKNMACLYNSL